MAQLLNKCVVVLVFTVTMWTGEDMKEACGEVRTKIELATFAGGCFWCMQPSFDVLEGVISTQVGYTGGTIADPTYEEVCSGTTGHAEAIEVKFDPSKISYKTLLDMFWRNIDPTTLNRQFADRGTQYRTVIYYHDGSQKEAAETSKENLQKSGKYNRSIVTTIEPAKEFFPAEEYHQCYYEKNPVHYNAYKYGSGRATYIEAMWGKEQD